MRNTKADENVVTDAVLKVVKTKKWIALKKEGGTEVPDVPEPPKPDADKEAPKVGTITEATATAIQLYEREMVCRYRQQNPCR